MTMTNDIKPANSALIGAAAAFALAWAIARACIQSITIDEADSFLVFVNHLEPFHWLPSSNNHILNTMLVRLSTSVFGLSAIAVRLPALIGSAIYVCVTYKCCMAVCDRKTTLRLALFVCLVYNPLIFDYLVAARGYSLALAFFAATILAAFDLFRVPDAGSPVKACATCSCFSALSVAGNFSFAFANIAAMVAVVVSALHRCEEDKRAGRPAVPRGVLLAACILPGLLVSLLLTASAVLHWPRGHLVFGARSLTETFSTIAASSVYEINENLVNPLLLPLIKRASTFVLPAAAIACGLHFVLVSVVSRRTRAELPRAMFGAFVLTVTVLTLFLHWIAFSAFGILLPKDRTALFIVFLLTLLAGIPITIRSHTVALLVANRISLASLCAVGICFLFCMRLNYFREWKYDADAKRAYFIVAHYHRVFGITAMASHWRYASVLNFYRLRYGDARLAPFRAVEGSAYDVDRHVYVLHALEDYGFLGAHHLEIVYHGELSDLVIAVRPDVVSLSTDLLRSTTAPARSAGSRRRDAAAGRF